jgi:hypothetical protein
MRKGLRYAGTFVFLCLLAVFFVAASGMNAAATEADPTAITEEDIDAASGMNAAATEAAPAAQSNQPQKKERVKGVVAAPIGTTVEGDDYVFKIAVFNNTDQQITAINDLTLTATYESGEKVSKRRKLTLNNPIAPHSVTSWSLKMDSKGDTGKKIDAEIYDATFEPYEEPDREKGPKSGDVLWTYTDSYLSKDKTYRYLKGNFLNNSAEDIVSLYYTLSFDHSHGKYVSHRGPSVLKTPFEAYGTRKFSPIIKEGLFSDIRNVKVTDISYMSRLTSARPTPAPAKTKQAPSQETASSGSGNSYGFNYKGMSRDGDRVIMSIEILNNSSTHTLARIDNAVIDYGSGRKQNLQTITLNIPPMGSKVHRFYANSEYSPKKMFGTPRFVKPPREKK